MAKECECEPDHSVAKLGHCFDCPNYRADQPTLIEYDLASALSCPPQHCDGTEHDYQWATYTDETMTTGVCRCGRRQIDASMLDLP